MHIDLSFDESLCTGSNSGESCLLHAEIEKLLASTRVAMLMNQERIELEEYSADSPIVKESVLDYT